MKKTALALAVTLGTTLGFSAQAADWSKTELHYQLGELKQTPFSPTGGDNEFTTTVLTFQHASGWKYGDNYYFIDYIDYDNNGTRENDFYGELYPNFSLGKISGKDLSFGPMKDIGITLGVNAGGESGVRKYLPGVKMFWDVPGAAFFSTLITAYIDDSAGVASGGAPKQTDSWMLDTAWAFPFSFGQHDFSIEGHAEYIASRENEFGGKVDWHILAQPQLRYDLGKALFQDPEHLFVGIEYQYWHHKLGSRVTESAPQLLVAWRF